MRKPTVEVRVGNLGIGGANPLRVQSMTDTLTSDVTATVAQIKALADAGSELVRFTVKDDNDAKAVPAIRDKLRKDGYDIPLIGDFHYNGHYLLTKYPDCVQALDKLRINPGNVGFGDHHDPNFETFIKQAITYNKPVRIGVNFGSLDQRVFMRLMDDNGKQPKDRQKSSDEIIVDAMLVSAMESIKLAESIGLPHNNIVLSVKLSRVPLMIQAYQALSAQTDLPLHLGVTEAGMGTKGIVSSTAGLSILLQQGIGDTIRTSLTPTPTSSRTEEVIVTQQILQLNGIRSFLPTVTSCPGCGRTSSKLFQEITEEINTFLLEKTPEWRNKRYDGFENMIIAVMGCVVNGPGESREANIGLSLPGTGEDPVSPVFVDGKKVCNLSGENRIDDFKKMIEDYVVSNYG